LKYQFFIFSQNVTEEDLESFLERIENHQPELIFTINDADQIDLETRQKLICDFQQKSVRLSFCDLPFARLGNKRKLKS
jgi:lipopolysaccharide biosynthesis glycosyltransferase